MSVARRMPGIWALVARELWRRTRRRLRAGPAYRWRYAGRTPERVLIAPPDLRIADPQIALEIYYGRFPLSGHLVDSGGHSPFQLDIANRGWMKSLHGFRWLRHMRAAGTELAAANARALVGDWIDLHGNRISGIAWEPAIVARRVIAWLQHSPVLLQGADFRFYRAFLRSLAVQVRYLRSMTAEMPHDRHRLRARVALALAALALPSTPATLRGATRTLIDELERQVLPDGGHVSRDPSAIIELLTDLLPLRQTYANQAESPPAALIGAIERMLPALRFFRLGDGGMARFNGMGATIQDRIVAILRHDDSAGAPLLQATHSGYQRMSLGGTTIVADTGTAPGADVSGAAHAGCLSFEMSSGRTLFVVNAGIDTYGTRDFHPLARATAAHSTATLNDTSSARFDLSASMNDLLGSPLVAGPRNVPVRRIDRPGLQGFVASHDGYASRFQIFHERELALSHEGNVVDGTDRFYKAGGTPAKNNGRDFVSVRFHLHPDIGVSHDDQDRLVLTAPAGDTFVFTATGIAPAVEESIFFADLAGPRRSRQIVLAFKASEHPEVRWRMTRTRLASNPRPR